MSQTDANWVAGWAGALAGPAASIQPMRDVTVPLRLPVSLGGSAIRLVLSNAYGRQPLKIGAASVTIVAADGSEGPVSRVRFAGEDAISIAEGAPALSDPVAVAVSANQTVLVKLYIPEEVLPETTVRQQSPDMPATHPFYRSQPDPPLARSAPGNQVDANGLSESGPGPAAFLGRIDVLARAPARTIAVVGTTFTDGFDVWPDMLAAVLAERGLTHLAIVNLSARAGNIARSSIQGGQPALVALLDRDILTLPGLTHVVLADARHDLASAGAPMIRADGTTPTGAADADTRTTDASLLKSAYLQLAARLHAHGVKVIVATMPPFQGVDPNYYSPAKDDLREELNRWLVESPAFDGIIDIDGQIRDPDDVRRFRPEYESSNRWAPNLAGHRLIAETVDLALFD